MYKTIKLYFSYSGFPTFALLNLWNHEEEMKEVQIVFDHRNHTLHSDSKKFDMRAHKKGTYSLTCGCIDPGGPFFKSFITLPPHWIPQETKVKAYPSYQIPLTAVVSTILDF